ALQAGHALDDVVVGGLVAVRAGLAEARDRGVDQSRVQRLRRLVGEAQARHRAGAEVLDQDVAAPDQPPQRLLAALALEVEDDAAPRALAGPEGSSSLPSRRAGHRSLR